jgi:hypothetical protein
MTTEQFVKSIRTTLQAIETRMPRWQDAPSATIVQKDASIIIKTYGASAFNIKQLMGYAGIPERFLPKGYVFKAFTAPNTKGDIHGIDNAYSLSIPFASESEMQEFLAFMDNNLKSHLETLGEPIKSTRRSMSAAVEAQRKNIASGKERG